MALLTWVLVALLGIGASLYSIYPGGEHMLPLASGPRVNHSHCKLLKEVGSVEDVVADETTGLVYLGSGTTKGRSKYFPGMSNHDHNVDNPETYRDKIYQFNPVTEQFKQLTIEGYDGQDFVSHGISMIPSEDPINDNSNYLFFVNHKRSGSVISVFKHKKGTDTVEFLHEFKHDKIFTPNSVAAISINEIYLTNDHYYKNKIGKTLEILVPYFANSNILHCIRDEKTKTSSCSIAVDRLKYANGIEYIPGRSEIVLAESATGRVTIFPRVSLPVPSVDTGAIETVSILDTTKSRSIYAGSYIDNVRRVPGTNDFVVATFPDQAKTVNLLAKKKGFAEIPLPAMALYFKESNNYNESQVLYHDGGEVLGFLTGFSVLPSKRQLVGGSCLFEGLLFCDLEYDSIEL